MVAGQVEIGQFKKTAYDFFLMSNVYLRKKE